VISKRRFYALAAGAGLVVVAYDLVNLLRPGGDRLAVGVQDIGEAVASLIATLACAHAARRAAGPTRLAWGLLAASAFAWTAGQVTWSVFEVGLQQAVPFPSLADAGYIAAAVLAIAGVVTFPSSQGAIRGRVRLLLDGGIVASCTIFVAWAVGLSGVYGQTQVDQSEKLLVLAYPTADLVLLTVVGTMIWLAPRGGRAFMTLLFAAFVAYLAADGVFAILTLGANYGALGSLWDAGWVAGYLLLGLAAIRGLGVSPPVARDDDVEIWQLAIPWVAVCAVIAASTWATVSGALLGNALGFIGTALGVLFISSQCWAAVDSVRILRRSRRAESQLRERTALLGEVIGRAPLGIARIGEDLCFIDANPRLCEMLATPARALLGTSMRQFLTDEAVAQASERMVRMRSGELPQAEVDGEMRCADGRSIWVHRSVMPVRNTAGVIDYYLVMFEDMTTKHETEQASLANFVALERLNRLKSEFMSMVSHEFRTALTGIQGYSELMSSEAVSSDEVKEFAGDINTDALRLNRMITEMLDLDRIESGRMVMHMEPIDLNRILVDAVDRARMSTHKHDITTQLDPGLPKVGADRDRVMQVVVNLLSNAVKYSPSGGEIVVTSRLDGRDVEVSVRDHGQGIPPEFVGRIFGRYERYEDAGTPQVVGTGLGLAITQQIIQLHMGRIWVESRPGDGSNFRFTIPVSEDGSADRAAPDSPVKVAVGAQR
jgi:PAS domain S-box-containing protein